MAKSTDKTMHSQIMKLLPWYVNHTVNDNDRKLIDSHLQSCVSCRIELKYQQQFAEKVKHSSDFEFASKQSFSRLKSRIHQSSSSESLNSVPSATTSNAEQRPFYKRWIDGFQATLLTPQAATVLAGFCIMLFAFDQIVSNRLSEKSTQPSPIFTVLAGNNQNAGKTDIRIIFEKSISSEQISRIVSSVNAKTIGEPNQYGLYRIRVEASNESRPMSVVQVAHLLNKQKGVVYAEPTIATLGSSLEK